MPRANNTDDEAVVPKRRTPRKRVINGTDIAVPRPPRRPRPIESVSVATTSGIAQVNRKAPTPLSAERTRGKRSTRSLFIALFVCALIATGGMLVGMTDGGQIDVVAVVNERNEKIGRGEVRDEQGNTVTLTVPVQDSDSRPNGGLTPIDPADTPPPPVPEVLPVATTTASTTESTEVGTTTTEVETGTEETSSTTE